MKAFVSYSVTDNNEFILTLLSSKLREKHFIVTTSQNFYSKIIDYNTMSEIGTSHLFIGVITGKGNERNRVLDEWNYAVQRNVPNLLLIEETVQVHQEFKGNYIRFNRNRPQTAIDEINRRMTSSQPSTSKSSDDIVPWILGGAALLAIIGLLSKDK
jgi:hypothetical protein